MEIVHVVLGKANPARMNGVNKVVNELATQQVLDGECVSLWGITRDPTHNYPDRNYTTALFLAGRNPFRLDRKLLQALDAVPPNTVFHLHGGFIPVFYSLAKALHKRQIPFIFTAHGSYNTIALERSSWRKKIYFRLFESRLLTFARAVHCLGRSEVDGVQAIYPGARTALIPYGFGLAQITAQQPDTSPFILGFCGRIDIYTKGLDLLLPAFQCFLRKIPDAALWIIGDSKKRASLEEMARQLGIGNNVIFWGSRYGQEKLDLIGRMRIFVHPSRNEGLPTAVLEAASLGVPCVVTEATNVGDSIRTFECGRVILHPDATELCQALLALYNDLKQDEPAFRERARRMVRIGYDWKQIVRQFHNLYQPV